MTGWAKWRLDSGKGYEEAKSEIDATDLDFVSNVLLWREANEQWYEDPQTPGMFAAYKDPSVMVIHSRLLPRMEEVTGLHLLPTYAYARIYRAGAILEKHKDRPACEVSATLLVGTNQDETWPLFIEGEKIIQRPGEMAVYRGCEVEHWREPMTGPDDAFHVQLFVHYVDADGPYSMCAGDKDNPVA
jgi:hypothetical protein